MVLDDLKDRLKSEAAQFSDRLQESSLYLTWKDRYDSLSPSRQKIVVVSAVAFILVLIFSMPLMTYWSSSDFVAEYEAKRDLIRELLRANKEANENVPSFVQPSMQSVRSQVDQAIAQQNLLPEQNRGVSVSNSSTPLIKSSIVDGILEISSLQLNVRQITNLATSLAKIQGTKLKDMILSASSKDPRYFDAVFRLVVFKADNTRSGGGADGEIPPPPAPPSQNGSAPKKKVGK